MPTSNAPVSLERRSLVLDAWHFIHRPRRYYAWLRRRYGDVVALAAPHATIVMALGPEGARQILMRESECYDALQKETFRGLAGDHSLFVLEGDRHRREREVLLPAFHARHVARYGQIILDALRRHSEPWRDGQVIQAHDVMLDITRDVILRVVFGEEPGPGLDEGPRALARMVSAAHPWLEYLPAFQGWWFPAWARFRRARDEFSTFAARCVAERRRCGIGGADVLDRLLSAQTGDGRPFSDEHVRDELYTILLPGHATTASALAWSLYELARHPEMLDRLRVEVETLGPAPHPDPLARLPFLGAVCDETLRLHTIVTEFGRQLRTAGTYFGHEMPAGTRLAVSISSIHQDAGLYPDPDRFIPDRFLERARSPFEFLPFGGGHRRCLGAALSNYEMRIVLATIVTRWDLEPQGDEREVRLNLGMGPKHGVRLRVAARRPQ